jgi:signal transduction histidine kinase
MSRGLSRRSLRLRLIVFAAAITAAVLAVAGIGLTELFGRNVERRVGQELDTHLAQLAGSLRFGADDALELAREPADPRFQRIFGGLYWQLRDEVTGTLLRSRSLWDSELPLPDDPLEPGNVHVHDATGPGGATVLVHEQLILAGTAVAEHRVRMAVAIDRTELNALRAGFVRDIVPALAAVGLLLVAGFAVQIRAGLQPLSVLRTGVAAIRSGAARRLDEDVPDEVAPLVAEVNTLLAQQDTAMIRARDRAADLAHGLKTPLTALAADARKLRAAGMGSVADDIDELVERMRGHVEREIARARLRHGAATKPVAVGPHVEAIVRALKRTPNGEALAFSAEMPPRLAARIEPDDLNEVLGNLMENAVRHAKSHIRISALAGDGVTLAIEDDGPGIDPATLDGLIERGRRLDEGDGAGLGLAIVFDILDEIGGVLSFAISDLGGLRVEVTLPA